jgi:hypothetical protein
MPGCEVHQKITEETLEVLCNEFEDFIDLCRLIDGGNRDVLINSVCDPDIRNLADYVTEIVEYCVCDGEEVDIDKCNELMPKRRELEQRLSYASSPDERRSIEEELRKIPRCKLQKTEPRQKPVKHHGGVNTTLWRYYVYTAAKDCLEASKGISGKARECMKRLARALHYAQDGPITRSIRIEGAYDVYAIQVDELHEVFEKGITEIIRHEINNFDISIPIREGVNMALNEKVFTISRELSSTEETSIVNAMKAMFRNTAYTFTKFIQIIRFVRKEGKKIQQLYMLYRALQIAGYVAIASLILLVFVLPHTLVHVLLTVIGASLIASSNLLYIKIRPMLCLYMNIGCEGYKKSILTEEERGKRTIVRKYHVL